MTEEQKKDILRDYNDRNKTVTEIAAKYGLQRGTLARIAIEQGATPRRPKAFGHNRGNHSTPRKCPECRNLTSVDGARFCAFCGADIRTNAQKLIERNNSLLNYLKFLPNNIRDEFVQTICDTMEELKKY